MFPSPEEIEDGSSIPRHLSGIRFRWIDHDSLAPSEKVSSFVLAVVLAQLDS